MATQMRELGYQECRALLGQGVVGRGARPKVLSG